MYDNYGITEAGEEENVTLIWTKMCPSIKIS